MEVKSPTYRAMSLVLVGSTYWPMMNGMTGMMRPMPMMERKAVKRIKRNGLLERMDLSIGLLYLFERYLGNFLVFSVTIELHAENK